MMIYMQPTDWADASDRYAFQVRVDSNNVVQIRKSAANTIRFNYTAGATSNALNDTSQTSNARFTQCVITWSKSNNRVRCYVNGAQSGATLTGLGTWVGTPASGNTLIGAFGASSLVFSGQLAYATIWTRELTAAEVQSLYFFNLSAEPNLIVTAPQNWQVYQRSGSTGTIAITGYVTGGTYDVEARYNGGGWATIAASAKGSFSGSLTGQAQGAGVCDVRLVAKPYIGSSATIGIGDVFIIAGQSNASGRGYNQQSYTRSGGVWASLFGNDYVWREMTDPTDNANNQVDAASSDLAFSPGGSVWPLVATSYLASQGVPCAFVPCALGGSSSTDWQPGASHTDRNTLYGSANYRASLTGAKAILWWQGEADALNNVTQATYTTKLTAIANAFFADRGVKLMPAKLQTCSGLTAPQAAEMNNAVIALWGTGNILTGPDLSGQTSDDSFHLQQDSKLASAATLWWNAIKAAFGW